MAKTAKKIVRRKPWSKDEHRALKAHSKARTPVVTISKQMKRTIGALRQQALKLGIGSATSVRRQRNLVLLVGVTKSPLPPFNCKQRMKCRVTDQKPAMRRFMLPRATGSPGSFFLKPHQRLPCSRTYRPTGRVWTAPTVYRCRSGYEPARRDSRSASSLDSLFMFCSKWGPDVVQREKARP